MLVPLVSYFIVKRSSESAIQMPRHYYPDSVVTSTKNGKEITDTVWHRLPDFSFTNQLGQQVSWKDIQGQSNSSRFFLYSLPHYLPCTYPEYETPPGWDH